MRLSIMNGVRVRQTQGELQRLRNEVTSWLAHRRKKDELDQYHTQLAILEKVIDAALRALGAEIAALDLNTAPGTFYDACRMFDDRLAWVRRLWLYFRHKFDQRDDPFLRPVLEAADEMTWSCYVEVFRNVQHGNAQIVRGASPLPYIESLFTPQAIPRTDPPPELESFVDAPFLKAFLKELPMPLISLPPGCVAAPWWLICLAHEAGHQVQYDLSPTLVASFNRLVAAAAQTPELESDSQAQRRWSNWGQEIFADIFSVFCAGPAAVRAMVELELTEESAMIEHKFNYPAPLVRMALLTRVADELGIDGKAELGEIFRVQIDALSPDPHAVAARDLRAVPAIVRSLLGQSLDGLGEFREVCGWDPGHFGANGTVASWAESLADDKEFHPPQQISSARLLVSSATRAWSRIIEERDDAKRDDQEEMLKEALLKKIKASREEGTRAGEAAQLKPAAELGVDFARRLMQASRRELHI